jgi:pyruvate/2-oxoglutarate dehydrogenase complex dihydrolipoamide acyltransferase (E2) component
VIEICVPKVGMELGDVTIVQILVAVGDAVTEGQPVVEVEGDKVTFEIEADEPGIVSEILVEAGQTAPVGAVLIRLTDGPPAVASS